MSLADISFKKVTDTLTSASLTLGVLPARFQLSPQQVQQIRLICSTWTEVLDGAERLGIPVPEVEVIVQRLDQELSSRSGHAGTLDLMRLRDAAVPNATGQHIQTTENGGTRSDIAESSIRRNVATPVVLGQTCTTAPDSQSSAPTPVKPISHENGVELDRGSSPYSRHSTSVRSVASSPQPEPQQPVISVADTIGNSGIQINAERLDSANTTAPEVDATLHTENTTEDTRQHTLSSNTNKSDSSDHAAPQYSASESPTIGKKLLSSTKDLLSSGNEIRSSSTPPLLPQSPSFPSPGPSLSILPPPPPLPKSPTTVATLPVTLPVAAMASSQPQIVLPTISSSSAANAVAVRPTAVKPALPPHNDQTVTTARSTTVPTMLPGALIAISTASPSPMQSSATYDVVSPQVGQQALAKGISPMPRMSDSASSSRSGSPSTTKSYNHSKLGANNVRKVTVGLNGLVTGRPRYAQFYKRVASASKQPLRPTLSSFDSDTHAQAINAARSRILQAQQGILAQTLSSPEQTAGPRVDAAARNASTSEDGTLTLKTSRTIYDVTGAKVTAGTSNQLNRVDKSPSSKAHSSPCLTGTGEREVINNPRPSGFSVNVENGTRNRNQKDKPSAKVSETALLSTLQNGVVRHSDTQLPIAASNRCQALPPSKSAGLPITGPQIAEQVPETASVVMEVVATVPENQTAEQETLSIGLISTTQTTPQDVQQSPIPSVNQPPSLRLPSMSIRERFASNPPLPEWLIGHVPKERGEGVVPPLPIWAYEPEYDAPDATYTNKRRRMHAPEPDWYEDVATSTCTSHQSKQISMVQSSDTAAPSGVSPHLPSAAFIVPAFAGTVDASDFVRKSSQRQEATPNVQPPNAYPKTIAISKTKDSSKVKHAKRAEEVVGIEINTPLDLPSNLASSLEESSRVSPSASLPSVLPPDSCNADHDSAPPDEDISMSDGTEEGLGTDTLTRLSFQTPHSTTGK